MYEKVLNKFLNKVMDKFEPEIINTVLESVVLSVVNYCLPARCFAARSNSKSSLPRYVLLESGDLPPQLPSSPSSSGSSWIKESYFLYCHPKVQSKSECVSRMVHPPSYSHRCLSPPLHNAAPPQTTRTAHRYRQRQTLPHRPGHSSVERLAPQYGEL